MAIPESGPLAEYGTIGVELGVAQTNVSIRGMSQTAGFTEPDAFSEFYGYSGAGCTDIVDDYDPFGGNGLALYQLNGDATDVSGNYDGTATNVTYGTGVFGQAAVFNGSSSKISSTAGFTGNAIFSFSFWVYPTANGTPIMFGNASTNAAFLTFIDATNKWINFGRYGDSLGSTPANSVPFNTWTHIAVSNNAGNVKCYINGSQQLSFSTTYSIGSNNVYIGAASTIQYLNGSIDQVRIFNTALTPLEVEALYTEELCICDGTVDTLDILGDGSCIATYQLDGNANDLSGNYSGTPTAVSYGVGEFDLAGVFNGSTSQIQIAQNILSTNAIASFSCWVKGASFSNSSGPPDIIFQNTQGGFYFAVITYASNVEIYIRNSSGTNFTAISYPLSNFNTVDWYNIVVTFSGLSSPINLYVNSNLVATATAPSSIIGYTLNNSIGGETGSSTLGWNGSIDQVRIFNKALSAGEVTTLYNETACTKVCTSGTTNTLDVLGDGSCIAAYPLDGSPLDLSGNYNGVQTDVNYTQGEFNLSGVFNNSTSNINIPGINGTSLTNNSFSIWAKGGQVVFGLRTNSSNNRQYSLHILNDSTIQLTIVNSAGNIVKNINSGTTINTSQWNHFVLTSNTVYVNGIQLTQFYTATAYPMSISAISGDTLMIGAKSDVVKIVQSSFNGQLDQFRLFNKALSASEVTTLYNETPCN